MRARIPRRQSRSVPERYGAPCRGRVVLWKIVKKKYIGDDLRPVEPEDIRRAKQTSLPDVVDPDGDLCGVGSSYGDFIEIISKELGLT